METYLETLATLLILALLNSFAILGIFHASHGEGMILAPVAEWLERKLGGFWSKPLLGCYKCMASVWAAMPFVIAGVALQGIESLIWVLPLAVAYGAVVSFFSVFFKAIYTFFDESL